MSVFQRLRFILVEPSHPGNVGAVARAMKTMGFSDLILVNPRVSEVTSHPDAIALASGAGDVLAGARLVSSIQEAVAGCKYAAAVSARLRQFSPPIITPRDFAAHVHNMHEVSAALIFGNERFGLPNEIVQDCNVLINIPSNAQYSSLNLSQAVQILAYECRVTAEQAGVATEVGFKGELAGRDQIDGMLNHLEKALVAIDFLDPTNPKKLMPRIKRLFSRTALEVEEVNILRGIAKKILDK